MRFARFVQTTCLTFAFAAALPAFAQEHGAPQPGQGKPPGAQVVEPAHAPVQSETHGEGGAEHGSPIVQTIARLLNFGILVGALVYYLRAPIAAHLSSRDEQIRRDLVTASDMRAAATVQLAGIEARMSALPGELDALRRQGAADVESEKARISEAAVQERNRLLDHTRRELDMRLRVAKRELTEHAARLAVQIAEQRIRRTITPDDHVRLIDRYASQLRDAR